MIALRSLDRDCSVRAYSQHGDERGERFEVVDDQQNVIAQLRRSDFIAARETQHPGS